MHNSHTSLSGVLTTSNNPQDSNNNLPVGSASDLSLVAIRDLPVKSASDPSAGSASNLFTGLLTWPTQVYAPPSSTVTPIDGVTATVVLRQVNSVVYLSPGAVSLIQRQSERISADPSTTLTKALTLAEYLYQEQDAGSTFLVQGKDNVVRRIVFNTHHHCE